MNDPATRSCFVKVIKAKAGGGREQNTPQSDELKRQPAQIVSRLAAILDLRIDGEITPEEYGIKRAELHERQASVRLSLKVTDRDDRNVADQAVKALELRQNFKNPIGKRGQFLQTHRLGDRAPEGVSELGKTGVFP
jgi:hypothetical protein